MKKCILGLGCVVAMLAASVARGVTLYSETASGDISGNRTSPTTRTLVNGSNDLFATSSSGDQEYLTVIVPSGLGLRNLILRSMTVGGFDQTAFIGMASGLPFPIDPNFASGAEMLGWSHFSPFQVNQDLFPTMRAQFGVQGFNTPLPPGSYSFVIQQLGTAVTYRFELVAVPEPTTAAAIAVGASLLVLRRRRRGV